MIAEVYINKGIAFENCSPDVEVGLVAEALQAEQAVGIIVPSKKQRYHSFMHYVHIHLLISHCSIFMYSHYLLCYLLT